MDDWAERLARGDPAAFEALYDACADRVHHALVVRLGSRTDADDVLQETFVRLARMRKSLAKVEHLMAYVFAISRNEANRFARCQSRSRAIPTAELLFQEGASDDLLERERAEWVAASLECLTPELREVVELKVYAGLTFREIALATGLPQGTVATRYRTAVERLRVQMAEDRE
jgi:RNA polymerase sigma-70 factor (ECF subfamily)